VIISWIPIKEEIMTKERAWPAKAMYILIAAALAIGLMIMTAPAQKASASPDISEWSRVDTPTTDGWVVAPGSTIIDYALAEAGEVAYAIVDQDDIGCADPCADDGSVQDGPGDYLLKSDDYAATWSDITSALEDLLDDNDYIMSLLRVETDTVDPDFVAVAVWWYDNSDTASHDTLSVFFSTDGGDTFEDADEVEDGGLTLAYGGPNQGLSDLAVSPEVSGKRDIVAGGIASDGNAGLFRCTVTGDSAGDWEDATAYNGWDDDGAFTSFGVTFMEFSPSWATDKTLLVTTVVFTAPFDIYLQSGSMGTSPGWNAKSTLGIDAVQVMHNVDIIGTPATMFDPRIIASFTLPEDYNSKNTDERLLWVSVNHFDVSKNPACTILRVDDDSADPVGPLGQVEDGEVWLTNVSYHGTIAEGEAIAGLLGSGTDVMSECCEGVQVYRNDAIHNMDICCERWHKACKPPTGMTSMAVSYVGEDKAYAVNLQGVFDGDEGAWSVTFDDGNTWNQLSLIDTYIGYFSDVAVSPDCNKTFLVSVHKVDIGYCGCDSVWLHADTLPEAEEYSGQWLRTWSGELEGDYWSEGYDGSEAGMLRLAPEETTGDTVYLFDYGTSNVYRNDMETLACWDPLGSTDLDEIVDVALQDADTLFALDYDGDVAMFADDEWSETVASEVEYGWSIAVWGDYILVGSAWDGEVSYCDDFLAEEPEFTLLDETVPIDGDNGHTTVAFDTYFDTNSVIYAAIEGWISDPCSEATGGIYSWVIGESEHWMDLNAEPTESQIGLPLNTVGGNTTDDPVQVGFTGIVLDRPGNPYTSPDNGGVIYATYVYWNDCSQQAATGVARSLERMVTVCTTCLAWDFLHVGLHPGDYSCPYPEGFEATPDALKICGCLTPDTNSHLFAIDSWWPYDFCDNDFGSVWTYEDCYAKKAPEITYPTDGKVIPADPCSCYSVPFTVLWDTLCDACSYDIAFAMDEEFDMPVKVNGETGLIYHVIADTPSYSVMGGEAGGLSCETTYYVRVRAADAATDEIIHSWWSDPIAITIAPSVEAGIVTLVAPAPGALNQPIKNVGFSWDLQATADAFDWVLSANADLSSPLDSKTGLTSKATSYAGTLTHGTTYYWQVKAYNEGSLLGTSAVGTFTTGAMGAFCDPVDGMCFDTLAELQAHQAAREAPGTPFWVWVVIAIGAVLVIVVIVLIFRTRRV
jgi:hypothetical protein